MKEDCRNGEKLKEDCRNGEKLKQRLGDDPQADPLEIEKRRKLRDGR